ncbi:Mitochondrial sodium/calcium exchanger protein [Bulinus truncatus]|nr:Mitochondrial sodium/calcium exchanger protein [Bulinus truncatus]
MSQRNRKCFIVTERENNVEIIDCVTFLAFGNGAPDIFSAIAAIGNAKAGDAGMAIGALFGAGVFVTAVVAGSISIIKPFKCMERPFLRDVVFYIAACYWAWEVLWDKKITQIEAAGFIILYVFYVFVVIFGHYINQKLKKRQTGDLLTKLCGERTIEDEQDGPLYRSIQTLPGDIEVEQAPLLPLSHEHKTNSMFKDFLEAVNPINVQEWKDKRIFGKVYELFKCPLVLVLKLTVPVVGEVSEDGADVLRNWNKLVNSLHVFTAPVFAMFATGVGFKTIGSVFPVYGLVMIICAILSIIVFLTSRRDHRPVYHTAFAYLGFVVAVIWIYSIANEIVNILQALGVVFDLSDAILGLTLLAWGNSIGDFIADTTLARQGYPRMGISACFGGPLFNLLLGLGIPFTIACIKKGGVFYLKVNLEQMVLAAGLTFSLASSLLIVPFSKFQMSRPYGIYLLILYFAFLVIAILTEVNVIENFDL